MLIGLNLTNTTNTMCMAVMNLSDDVRYKKRLCGLIPEPKNLKNMNPFLT